MRRLRSLASNSLIAFISINFRSDEAVRVATDRSGPTGNVPLHENRLAGRESVGCVQPIDAPEPSRVAQLSIERDVYLNPANARPSAQLSAAPNSGSSAKGTRQTDAASDDAAKDVAGKSNEGRRTDR